MWEMQSLFQQEVIPIMSSLCLWGGADLNLLREEVRLYSCTPRNFSVSLREELKRTDAIFWPSCLLVKRCGGNCACCSHRCYDCQCVPARVTKKYHEVNINMIMKYEEHGTCNLLITLRHLQQSLNFQTNFTFQRLIMKLLIKNFTTQYFQLS